MPEFDHPQTGRSPESDSGAGSAPGRPADVDAGGADVGSSPTDPGVDPAAGAGAAEPELAEAEVLDATVVEGAEAEEVDGAVVSESEPSPEERANQYLALAQRTQADFENFRKRAARDAAQAGQRAVAKLTRDLLPALDNLERAITHAPAEDPLLEGIKLVLSDLQGALTRAGIESFDPSGESFDPNLHEAVAQLPKEGVAAGTVVEVYQQGYRVGDTVLRPARVVVSA